jgi:hypothetical protein
MCCGKRIVDRDDLLETLCPGSMTLAGGAKPSVWIGAGKGRPDVLTERLSFGPVTALSAMDELVDIGCRYCDVDDGLELVVEFIYGACGAVGDASRSSPWLNALTGRL